MNGVDREDLGLLIQRLCTHGRAQALLDKAANFSQRRPRYGSPDPA